ncbi:hypothetical protein ANSO36C_12660 [Nostoc cf. commune SO-36]|uniref:Uncharacterized protein n=1 Tax=Nostoc cf. commune SO-36 TaxID=449208 RepID=A0ABN6PZA5_NOSCO|nr:DUF3387 domain-containing protein [Nostoc commune]BDI15464.1 hypothetical protein ANSO36C_12660 [Nostoc cf. commune SO-36]
MEKLYWFNSPPYNTFEVGLFQAIRAAFVKHTTAKGNSPEDLDGFIKLILYSKTLRVFIHQRFY